MSTAPTALRGSVRIHRIEVAGRPLVAKSAHGRTRALLRREAELLTALDDAPVTELVALREHDDRTDLVLVDAGRVHLADPSGLSPAALQTAITSAIAALDDLHEAGWSHGAICGEHVVTDDEGRVRLCSLGSARPIGDDPDAPAEDLARLRDLIDRLADHRDPDWSRAQVRQWRRRHAAVASHGRPRMSPVTLGLLGGIATVGAASLLLGGHAVARATPTTSPAPTPSTASPPVMPTIAGNQLRLDGRTYRAGRPGDVVALDDHDCTGRPRVLLLRPATGQVFGFDAWPEPGRPAAARLVTLAPGARRLETTSRDGCSTARLVHGDGSSSEVPPPPPGPTNGAPQP